MRRALDSCKCCSMDANAIAEFWEVPAHGWRRNWAHHQGWATSAWPLLHRGKPGGVGQLLIGQGRLGKLAAHWVHEQ